MISIDTGDSVFHRPTREWWSVACVQGDELSWCGWPEGSAKLKDCLLVTKATAEERLTLLRQLAEMRGDNGQGDHRQRFAIHALSQKDHSGG